MISLEKARALKEAGLKWDPCRGDWYFYISRRQFVKYTSEADVIKSDPESDNYTFCPRLDQLLGEIQSRFKINQWWEMADDWFSIYELRNIDGAEGSVLIKSIHDSDTPEDAAADALLWLIGQQ